MGGILIAIKNKFQAKLINISKNNLETLFITLKFKYQKIILSCVYIPPASPLNIIQDYCQVLEEVIRDNAHSQVLLVGDFNLPRLMTSLPPDNQTEYLIHTLALCNLYQYNTTLTLIGSTLDLIIGYHLSR
uniref:Endonuclease/exonuclease/phosphatase domain-containing protein n=1 Tax=Cacopsylla melanoneura TaxID=428564 RepID=A0A8D8Z8I9_9HEMI